MAKYTFEQLKASYTPLWRDAKVTKVAAAKSQAELILKHKAVYLLSEKDTNVPWWVIAIMHLREAGPQDVGKWQRVLHNGQRIIGTGRKTTIVPTGRGPFTDWRSATFDALVTVKHFDKIKDWSPERVAYIFESYNGFGYRGKGIPSPYLWGGTTVQKRGKYVADHVYDPNVMDSQIGAMAILMELMKLDASVLAGRPIPTPAPPKPAPTRGAETGTVIGTGAAGTAVLTSTPVQYWPYVIAGTIISIIIGLAIVSWYKKRQAEKEINNG